MSSPAEQVKSVLQLKVGAQVMLQQRLKGRERLVNGSRGVVVRFAGTSTVVVRFADVRPAFRASVKCLGEDMLSWPIAPAHILYIPMHMQGMLTVSSLIEPGMPSSHSKLVITACIHLCRARRCTLAERSGRSKSLRAQWLSGHRCALTPLGKLTAALLQDETTSLHSLQTLRLALHRALLLQSQSIAPCV